MIIKPQPWYQEKVLSCPADIVIWWWSAGAGKTFSLLLDPMRGFSRPWFRGVIFRRTMPQIKWWWWLRDESIKIYSWLRNAKPIESTSKWVFESGAEIKFSHMEYEKNMLDHQWLQYAFIGFDELTHFTKKQFFYLLTRNRSDCWIRPYIRCTCNPDPDSRVRDFIDRWIDKDGYIIKDRDGVIRYFTIDKDNVIRGDSYEDVAQRIPHLLKEWDDPREYIKSFTFIEWDLEENKILLSIDKSYRANLMTQDESTRRALLERNRSHSNNEDDLFSNIKLRDLSSNYVEWSEMYITVDVAWFWKDLAVIKVWQWLRCRKIRIYSKSSPDDLMKWIEIEREWYKVPSSNVLYDNDWLWWWLAWRNYIAFMWWWPTLEIEWSREMYANLKTQLYYHLAEKVNANLISYRDCDIVVDWVNTDSITIWSKTMRILDMLLSDLRAIKRDKTDAEFKKHINSKAQQKNILWRSPDLWDTAMMRMYFEFGNKYIEINDDRYI